MKNKYGDSAGCLNFNSGFLVLFLLSVTAPSSAMNIGGMEGVTRVISTYLVISLIACIINFIIAFNNKRRKGRYLKLALILYCIQLPLGFSVLLVSASLFYLIIPSLLVLQAALLFRSYDYDNRHQDIRNKTRLSE